MFSDGRITGIGFDRIPATQLKKQAAGVASAPLVLDEKDTDLTEQEAAVRRGDTTTAPAGLGHRTTTIRHHSR